MGITTKVNVLLCVVFWLFVRMGFSLGGSLETDSRPSDYKEQMLQRLKEQNKSIIAEQNGVKHKVSSWAITATAPLRGDGGIQQREAQLQQVEITVDLKHMPEYHDRLASYAYNHCKERLSRTPWKTKWKYDYSCEKLVKVWQAENGWRNKDVKGVTSDWGLCQLNPRYHSKFLSSEWYSNPLAQIEYCQWVWEDAARKNVMPWYAYNATQKRSDPYVLFVK